jgi:Ca2+-binding RTX toxin-like protein
MVGGPGNDTYHVDSSGDITTESSVTGGIDTIISSITMALGGSRPNIENLTLSGFNSINATGTGAGNLITGNAADNSLLGLGGNDTLIGGAGPDTLSGGTGADSMEGGMGADAYVVDNPGDIVVEAVDAGVDRVSASISYTLSAEVENLYLTGTASSGSGNGLANLIQGNDSDNTLYGLDGADTLIGAGGADTLDGGTGADKMQGGSGNDIYYVDVAGDQTVESSTDPLEVDLVISSVSRALNSNLENLTLVGGAAVGTGNALNNQVIGNALANNLQGVAGADTLIGGAGNDTLNGGTGADRMEGGEGDDVYAVENAGDVVVELAGQGVDRIGSTVSWVLGDNVENLTLAGAGAIGGTGNGLNNVISGNGNANLIDGGSGDDTLTGGNGADTLIGGDGQDSLSGGAGADVFRFVTTAEGGDEISDFASGTDRIWVSAANFGLTAGSQNLVNGASASSGAAVFLYNATTGALSFDQDGNESGAAITLAILRNRPASLAVGDLVAG